MKLKKLIKKVEKMRKEGTLPKIKHRKIVTRFGTVILIDHPMFYTKNPPLEIEPL